MSRVASTGFPVAPGLPADGRGGSMDQAGDLAQTEALGSTELDGDAFFDAEFVISHGAAPYRKGQVLHSVSAAAHYIP
ncbi:hypothetical protein D3C85_1490180 [compost metagenome]